jgi:hypothetical protein
MTQEQIEQLACNMSLLDMQFHYELLRQALRNTISRHLADNGGEIECNILVQETMGLSDAEVYGNARVSGNADYIVFKNWWSSGRYFTWTRSNNMWSVGCFYGTGEELIKKAYQDSEKSGRGYERVVKFVQSILEEEE